MRLAMQYFPGHKPKSLTRMTEITESKLLFYLVTRGLPNGFNVGGKKSLR
jgi:hypothetical protein